jgi:hypothetical protein
MLCLAALGVPARASAADPIPDQGTFGISLLDVPANSGSDPRALTKIVDHLAPGAVIKRRVLLMNNLLERKQFQVYAGAATVGHGRFQVGEGHADNELTSWISLDRSSVTMRPGGKTPVEVTIRVPSTASTGERYAMVWLSLSSKANGSADVGGIYVVNRVGVRIYLHIGPGDEPPSEFTIGKVVPARDEQGRPTLTVEVNNTGDRALDLTGKVDLSDGPDDARAGPFTLSTTTLAPGEPGKVTAQLPDNLAGGPWKIELTLTSGRVHHGANGTITFPDAGTTGKPSTLVTSSAAWTTVGASLAVGLVTVTGLALAARRVRRKTGTTVA